MFDPARKNYGAIRETPCPGYENYGQFDAMVEKGDVEKLAESKSIFKCLSCFACVDRCPRGVEPAKVIEAVRVAVVRKQGQNHFKPEQIPAMLEEDMPQQLFASAFRKYSK